MGDDALKALEDYKKEQENYNASIQFLDVQVSAHQSLAIRLGQILQIASKEYEGILGLKDAQKFFTMDLLISIASIALPGLGQISDGLDKMAKSEDKIVRVIAHFGGSASDYNGLVQSYKDNADADDSSSQLSGGSNYVVRDAALKVDKALGQAMIWRAFLKPLIKNNKFTEAQTRDSWIASGLPVLSDITVGAILMNRENFDLITQVFLYEMLKNYTHRYVTYNFGDFSGQRFNTRFQNFNAGREWTADAFTLPEDGNQFGTFTGMSQATRDAIYARFGTQLWASKRAKHQRPQISQYREMIKYWKMGATY